MSGDLILRPHSIPADQFAALARGTGAASTVKRLVAAQRSRHLLLLARVAELARRADRPDDRLARPAWDLLAAVQQEDRAAADEVIGYPSVGAWAWHTIRPDLTLPAMPAARPSGLAAVAAAAAIRAGLDAEIEVPVVDGSVMLPSLGAADAVGGTAVVAARAAEVRSDGLLVTARPGAAGWHDVRSVTVGALTVLIDDLDPFRMPAPGGRPAGRLTPAQLADVGDTLGAAWPLLSPAGAAEIAAAVKVIVPYQAPESGHTSISSPQTFGTVALSRQPDEYTCAETLVHETQHLKLNALLDLVRLTRPGSGQRYYAPWRTDPRPAEGLLQGAYAFLGVGGFWREQRAAAEPSVRQRAQSEFARWRESVSEVVDTLLGSGQLTEHGLAFVREMAETLSGWRREPVPDEAITAARAKSERHRAQWDADNG